MNPARRCRSGFTLTEILMAAGILGIGMTMVATVFPVAVDQSRRSREATMAALCARSVAATLRARRDKMYTFLRGVRDRTTLIDSTYLPDALRAYNPNLFLYASNNRRYEPERIGYGLWSMGSYVPVVFATPVRDPNYTTSPGTSYGPWRITIVVYRAVGQTPDHLLRVLNNWAVNPCYLEKWSYVHETTTYPCRGSVGSYILDAPPPGSTQPNFRGEAYLIDKVTPDATSPTPDKDKIVLAAQQTAGNFPVSGATNPTYTPPTMTTPGTVPGWISMPGALTAYHTIIGE